MLTVGKLLGSASILALVGTSTTVLAQGAAAPPAAPAASAPAAPVAEIGPGFLGKIAIRFDMARREFALTPLGMLMQKAKKPINTLSGGLLANPIKPNAKDLAQPGAAGAAAAAKKDAIEMKKRKEDVKYLGKLDCRYYPNASQALADSLRTDPCEEVRYEAAVALNSGCSCNTGTIKALMASVSGMEPDGNPAEKSVRVRCTAAKALEHCLASYCPPAVEVEDPDPTIHGEKSGGNSGEKGNGENKKNSDSDSNSSQKTSRSPDRMPPSPKLVQRARDTLQEFQGMLATSAPESHLHTEVIAQPAEIKLSTPAVSIAPPAGSTTGVATPFVAPAMTPPESRPGQARVNPPADSTVTPAAALSPQFQLHADDTSATREISLRCLNRNDVPGQHRAIRELVRIDWKAQPLVAATLLHGAKNTQFREEVRVDCLRMLALCHVNHVEVLEGLSALASDSSEWVRQEATTALASLKANR